MVRLLGDDVCLGDTVRPVTVTSVDLDLTADPVDLTAALVDVPSVSGEEDAIADAVQRALAAQAPHLRLLRSGNTVLARTELGRSRRVLLAGHLDTVPVAGNLPSWRCGELLHGCGTSDMKSGDAMILHLAASHSGCSRSIRPSPLSASSTSSHS
jgi:succinyl-diaminopimelate desuccinylase